MGSGLATCDGTVANGAGHRHEELRRSTRLRGAHHGRRGQFRRRRASHTVHHDFTVFWPVGRTCQRDEVEGRPPCPDPLTLNGFMGARPEAEGYPRSMRCGGGGDGRNRARGPGQEEGFVRVRRRSDKYVMLWKTDKTGAPRDFVLKLDDGSLHTARFEFSKTLNLLFRRSAYPMGGRPNEASGPARFGVRAGMRAGCFPARSWRRRSRLRPPPRPHQIVPEVFTWNASGGP